MTAAPVIWALVDARLGHANQCLAVADALGLPYHAKSLGYNRRARLPNVLLGARVGHLTATSAAMLVAPWPDLVIAAGRRTAPVARYIKRRSEGRCRLVQIMRPEWRSGDFDLIAVPEHDRLNTGDNLIRTIGAPHRVTRARIDAAANEWAARVDNLPRPLFAVVLGGSTRRHPLPPEAAAQLGRDVSIFAKCYGGGVLATDSPRTPPAAAEAMVAALDAPHLWVPFSTDPSANPYLGFLGLAEAVVVTGDSASMCTEACATGKPVYIFSAADRTAPKHLALHRTLYELGYAHPLDEAPADPFVAPRPVEPLEDAAVVARAVRERFGI